MASAIRNHVVDGLNGVDVTSFSMVQLEDEILMNAPGIILELSTKGIIDIGRLPQRIDGIKVAEKDLSANCTVEAESCAPHFEIPNINRAATEPILYLGTMDGSLSFKVYYDRDYRFHKYRLATSKKPFAWISSAVNSEGLYDVFLFNLGRYSNIQFLSMDILLDNPYDLLNTDYYDQFSAAEFYAPLIVQTAIIDKITQKYIGYYRQLHAQPKPNIQQV